MDVVDGVLGRDSSPSLILSRSRCGKRHRCPSMDSASQQTKSITIHFFLF